MILTECQSIGGGASVATENVLCVEWRVCLACLHFSKFSKIAFVRSSPLAAPCGPGWDFTVDFLIENYSLKISPKSLIVQHCERSELSKDKLFTKGVSFGKCQLLNLANFGKSNQKPKWHQLQNYFSDVTDLLVIWYEMRDLVGQIAHCVIHMVWI